MAHFKNKKNYFTILTCSIVDAETKMMNINETGARKITGVCPYDVDIATGDTIGDIPLLSMQNVILTVDSIIFEESKGNYDRKMKRFIAYCK